MTDYSWRIGGEAGYGIDTAGNLFAIMCMKHGLNIVGEREYPSLIRGGHNTFTIRLSNNRITTHSSKINILCALNELTIKEESSDLASNGLLIHDESISYKGKSLKISLIKIAEKHGEPKMMMNTVIIGVSAGLFGMSKKLCNNAIKEFFKNKSDKIINSNINAFNEAYNLVKPEFKVAAIKQKPRMLISGNIAFGIGALRAGCNFISSYPMTPATSLMEYLFSKAEEIGVRAVQSEDETSALNTAIGASYAGARAFACTSGGGFALMTEALSLAGMSETPVVIALSQRPGPATGLPTRTEQGDLLFALNAGHGEFTKVILAPGDVNECYEDGINSFNIAEKYQVPVIVLLDKHLSENPVSNELFKDNYSINRGELILKNKSLPENHKFKRYLITKNGISLRPLPGIKNAISCSIGDEHDEEGFIIESGKQRQLMADKRLRKNELINKELSNGVKIHGKGEIIIVGWGSTKGAILEAQEHLRKEGINTKFIQVRIINPFPTKAFNGINNLIVIENNRDGQLSKLIAQNCLIKPALINKYNGRPFTSEEVITKIKKVIK